MKCKRFCNIHCAYDCPDVAAEAFEDRFDIPASDAGYERIGCKNCHYNENCDCGDCFFEGDKNCPKCNK